LFGVGVLWGFFAVVLFLEINEREVTVTVTSRQRAQGRRAGCGGQFLDVL
jgi:hypothetical protein